MPTDSLGNRLNRTNPSDVDRRPAQNHTIFLSMILLSAAGSQPQHRHDVDLSAEFVRRAVGRPDSNHCHQVVHYREGNPSTRSV
jgi:hypothetical protein